MQNASTPADAHRSSVLSPPPLHTQRKHRRSLQGWLFDRLHHANIAGRDSHFEEHDLRMKPKVTNGDIVCAALVPIGFVVVLAIFTVQTIADPLFRWAAQVRDAVPTWRLDGYIEYYGVMTTELVVDEVYAGGGEARQDAAANATVVYDYNLPTGTSIKDSDSHTKLTWCNSLLRDEGLYPLKNSIHPAVVVQQPINWDGDWAKHRKTADEPSHEYDYAIGDFPFCNVAVRDLVVVPHVRFAAVADEEPIGMRVSNIRQDPKAATEFSSEDTENKEEKANAFDKKTRKAFLRGEHGGGFEVLLAAGESKTVTLQLTVLENPNWPWVTRRNKVIRAIAVETHGAGVGCDEAGRLAVGGARCVRLVPATNVFVIREGMDVAKLWLTMFGFAGGAITLTLVIMGGLAKACCAPCWCKAWCLAVAPVSAAAPAADAGGSAPVPSSLELTQQPPAKDAIVGKKKKAARPATTGHRLSVSQPHASPRPASVPAAAVKATVGRQVSTKSALSAV